VRLISPLTISKAEKLKVKELKQTSPERFTLTFDDGTELKTTLGVITDRFVHSGAELSETEYGELVSASSLSLCKARAIRIISQRRLSKKELIKKLCEKGESPENAESCAEWLVSVGLLDDASYAGAIVRHYSAKGYGIGRIRQELRHHGVPTGLWEAALEEMPEQDERLEKYIRSHLDDVNDRAKIKKVSDALYRRGYGWDEIKHALNTIKAETEDFS